MLFSSAEYAGDGWSSNIKEIEQNQWVGDKQDSAWELEHVYRYRGEIVPLLAWNSSDILLVVGGVFIIYRYLADSPFAVIQGPSVLDAKDLRERLTEDWWDELDLYEPPADYSKIHRFSTSRSKWDEEVKRGRNRWEEQHLRGGKPPLSLVYPPKGGVDKRDLWPV